MTDNSAYSLPEIYKIAFSFRDYKQAVDFLQEVSLEHGLSNIKTIVELGCGPAQYAREFSKRGIKSYGIDNSSEMVNYARDLSAHDKLDCEIIEADMCSFQLPEKVELAVCMMATIHCLLDNQDIVKHLNSVADNLIDNGLYIIEMTHPRDFLNLEAGVEVVWEMTEGNIKVKTDWGSDSIIDPLTEVSTGTVKFEITSDGQTSHHSFKDQFHNISHGLMRSLIKLSGRFQIAAMYGDLDKNIPFSNDKKSWRMIFVLQKYS